jgi:predicted lipid-binding transport protein (Tim44 family)
MTDQQLTLEQALHVVAAAAAAEVDRVTGDPDLFEKQAEMDALHLQALALVERLAQGDTATIPELLPGSHMEGLAQVLALGALAVHLARGTGDPDRALTEARASLLARLAQGGDQ